MTTLTTCRTLVEALDLAVARDGDAPAVRWGDRALTYGELAARVHRVAAGFAGLGLVPGDRVAIWAPNTGEFVELYLGAAAGGQIAVPVNFRFTPTEADHVLGDARPAALVIASEHLDTFARTRFAGEHGADLPVLVLSDGLLAARHPDPAGLGATRDYEPWLAAQDPAGTAHRPTAEDPFFIGYTSGTTGFPKGAVVAQGPMIDNARQLIAEYADLGPDDRFLTLMPLFHSNSTWFAVTCVLTGATNVVAPSGGLDGRRIVELVDHHGVTATSVVPTILRMMLEGHRELGLRGSTLRFLLSGSAPMTPALKTEIVETFDAALFEGYGATETGIVTSLPAEEQLDHLRSVGRVVTGKQIELRDPHGVPVPVGEVGELWVRGEGVLLTEYRGLPEATAEARDADGWLTVGDMARIDAEGYVELVDRKKDMIISGGENVYPTEVEEVLLQHEAVAEVAVVGLPDERWGERVHAVVVPPLGVEPDRDELLAVARAQLASYKLPRSIDVVPELPRTPTGKIQRRRVRDLVLTRD